MLCNCKTNFTLPQERRHFSLLLAVLPVSSWLLARGVSSHSPTPVDIPRRIYRLELSSACSRKCLRAGAGISNSKVPEQGPKPTFSCSLGQLCWAQGESPIPGAHGESPIPGVHSRGDASNNHPAARKICPCWGSCSKGEPGHC